MAVYAIGDVHGCLEELHHLLHRLAFDTERDRLLFVGDLVNRGPHSLACLRFVHNLGTRHQVILGNHEINVLRQFAKGGPATREPWQDEWNRAPDRDALLDWVSRLPLMLRDEETGIHLAHAGCHPSWPLDEALARATTIGRMSGGLEHMATFYAPLNRSPRAHPREELRRLAWEEQNLFTRIRLCAPDGRPVWPHEARQSGMHDPYAPPAEDAPFQPWYRVRQWHPNELMVYGHWAAMGLNRTPHTLGLDSGCVYGGHLTAVRLDHPDHPVTQVACPRYFAIDRET
ncbi:MAG: symmetrical bis(5'-nucleosyl)-tetraphosphatase [Magnetococcales bacterium]|nr:symmetrical bis(5'-nucleosyl)-tetraphosphatase [Magnetococcales bacterium]